jgi:hypothetical protein
LNRFQQSEIVRKVFNEILTSSESGIATFNSSSKWPSHGNGEYLLLTDL